MEEGLRTYEYTQGDARLLGFEAGIDFHPIHSIHFENTFSYVDAQQLNRAYQNHLSRLKYTDVNNVTGEQGVFNMGRNIVFKLLIPITL